MGMRGIYFDMGGVLMEVDSRFNRLDATLYSLDDPAVREFLGKDFDVENYVSAVTGMIKKRYYTTKTTAQPDAWLVLRAELEKCLKKPVPFEIHKVIFWRYVDFMSDCFRLKPGVRDILEFCRSEKYIMGLISNVFHPSIVYKQLFTKWSIIDYFHPLVFSSDLYFRKPDRRIFEYALAFHPDLQPKACFFVGDTFYTDIQGALNVGMKPVWLNSEATVPDIDDVIRIHDLDELRLILK